MGQQPHGQGGLVAGAASFPACLLELGETAGNPARATSPVYLVTTPPTLHKAEAQGHSHKCETSSPCGRTTNPLQLCIHVWHRQAQQTRLRGSGTLSWRRLGQKSGLAESSGTVSTAPGLPAAPTASGDSLRAQGSSSTRFQKAAKEFHFRIVSNLGQCQQAASEEPKSRATELD